MLENSHPTIIQGGMGVGVSHWPLARAVSACGQLGVVSGTALDLLLHRKLQDGDPGGHLRRALDRLPLPGVAARLLANSFLPEGRKPGRPYKGLPMVAAHPTRESAEWLVAANFAEVFLAKEGHAGPIGINYLHKVQLPTLPSLFGAILAGVDYVLMGAGIPMDIPGAIDSLARGEPVRLQLEVEDALPGEMFWSEFVPREWFDGPLPPLGRPFFLAIVSSAVLAMALARKASGRVDGFVVENASAGGHNAPPRGTPARNERGEPVFGPRDVPDIAKIRSLGLPFWLAGSEAGPERLAEARAQGANGVQVGSAFAFCEESGIDPSIKARVLAESVAGTLDVFTDPLASPTGFPFKVVGVAGTVSESEVYQGRPRLCDLGYLRRLYRKPDGTIGYRCPGEPVNLYASKGGALADTVGRKCVCNGLMATIGRAQIQPGGLAEPALVTAGQDARRLARFLDPGAHGYTVADVLRHLLGQSFATTATTP